jgi:hypothetical protein
MTTPFDSDRYSEQRDRSVLSRSFVPLALITLGVVFLLGNLVQGPGRGGLVMLGLGAAFAIGRLTTGRYGYSVPAGILMAIGAFVILNGTTGTQLVHNSGWFFVLLGLGFVLSYVIGMRPGAVWPLFPATVLIGLGLILFGWASAAPIASFAWIAGYWPVALVLVGLWLLFRDHLPLALRQPVGTLGGIALLGYGLLAAVASVAAAGSLMRPDFMANFGSTAYSDTITYDLPIVSGDTFNVTNSSGRTSVRVGAADIAHVVATRHFSVQGQPPEVRLTPGAQSVSLDMPENRPTIGQRSWVDYAIEVPAGVQVKARSSSGALDIEGLQGAVQAEVSSGDLTLTNIAGDLDARSSSGRVRGSQLSHVRQVQSNSGSVSLDGVFTDAAQIRTSSGSVEVKFGPSSAVALDVRTRSGGIHERGLGLTNRRDDHNSLTGNVGAPASGAVLSIQTSSGSVTLSN